MPKYGKVNDWGGNSISKAPADPTDMPDMIRTDENHEGAGYETLREAGLTLMYPCFGQEKRISKLLQGWDAWSDDLKEHVQIILIDDHGTPSIEDMLSDKTADYNLSVYRIQDDVKYNMPGALNLGMMVASTPWILTMDTDYSFPLDVMQRLLDFKPAQGEVYSFFLDRVTDGVHVARDMKVHTNTFLLHRDMFIDLNGFDEDFSGKWSHELQPVLNELGRLPAGFSKATQGYGYHDCAFIYKLKSAGYMYVQQRGYIATEWVDDKNTGYTKAELRLGRGMYYAKLQGQLPFSTDMLRFKWRRVIL